MSDAGERSSDASAPAGQAARRAAHAAATVDQRARLERALHELIARCGRPRDALDDRPASGGWTGAEVLEHVVLMHRFVFVLVEKLARRCRARLAQGASWPTAPPALDVVAALADSGRAWPHPEHMTPTGGIAPDDAALQLLADREQLLTWLDEMPAGEGTLHRIRMSRIEGDTGNDRLDLYQWIELVLRHAERHARQIDRTESGTFPSA